MDRLTSSQIKQGLVKLDGWTLAEGAITKQFKFKDFAQAMAFINQLAKTAEKLNHHPDLHNSYNKVELNLSTHSAGGLTEKDFELAAAADDISRSLDMR